MFASGFFAKASVPSAGRFIQSAKQCSLSLFGRRKSISQRIDALDANVKALENRVSSAAGRLRCHDVAECHDLVTKYRDKAGFILVDLNSKSRSRGSWCERNAKRTRIQELNKSLKQVTASLHQEVVRDRTQQLTDCALRQAVGLGHKNAPLPPLSVVLQAEQATQTGM